MIAYRGTGSDHTPNARVWDNEVGLSTGLTPKGKPRETFAIVPYTSWRRATGIDLLKGEIVEITAMKVRPVK